jgi:hypothetical protein
MMLCLFLAKIFAVVTNQVDQREGKLPINKKNDLAFKGMVVWTSISDKLWLVLNSPKISG